MNAADDRDSILARYIRSSMSGRRMNMRSRLLSVTAALTAVVLLTLAGCGSTGPEDPCWVGVDTVFVSGLPVGDAEDVEGVFARYAAFADSTGGSLPEGVTELEYRSAEYYWEWRDVDSSRIAPRGDIAAEQRWQDRETLYVDENGVLVAPLGCI